MSLIITSNVQDEYSSHDINGDITNIPTGIQNPASFSNHLRNPMIIAPNSEVAVSSVKINRLPVWDIKAGNRFFFNQGRALEDGNGNPVYSQSDTMSVPVPILMSEGTFTQTQMQHELQRLLRIANSHPNFWKTVVVDDHHTKALDAPWKGFQFKFGANAGPTTDVAQLMTGWRGFDDRTSRDASAATWSLAHGGSDTTITRNLLGSSHPYECSIINTDCPMDLLTGVVELELFTFAQRINPAGFFFTRPKLYGDAGNPFLIADGQRDKIGGEGEEAPEAELEPQVYGDYRVDWTSDLDSGDMYLVLSQAVWDPLALGGEGGIKMKEVNYWQGLPGGDNGGANPVKNQINDSYITNPDDGGANQGNDGYIGLFKAEFIGSGIKISMGYHTKGNAAKTWKVICDTTLAANRVNHEYVWTPISQNNEALYMGVSMAEKNDTIQITKMIWNETYVRQAGYLFGDETNAGSSFWSKCIQGKDDGDRDGLNLELAKLVESRVNQEMKSGTTIHWYDKTAASDAIGLSRALIVNTPRDTAPEQKGIYYPARGANMGFQLGFQYWDSVSSSQQGATTTLAGAVVGDPSAVWSIASAQVPHLKNHSAFVKVPSLTPQSFNFCKSIPSQILYHLPRFDNSGRQYGELFFECPEKTYIDMKNIDFINLNNLDIQVVDKDERLVRDLSGDTTIVLHIRHKSDRY